MVGNGEKSVVHIGPEFEITGATNDVLVVRVIKMTIQNLFRECEGAIEPG